MKKKILYLDIDGVLLTVKQTKPATHANEFITYVIEQFDCYWLTTHCKGSSDNALRYLGAYFDRKTVKMLNQVKPTNWTTLKTEAIDFSRNFTWLEDYPLDSEKKVLSTNNCLNNLVLVNLNNKDELKRVMALLEATKQTASNDKLQ